MVCHTMARRFVCGSGGAHNLPLAYFRKPLKSGVFIVSTITDDPTSEVNGSSSIVISFLRVAMSLSTTFIKYSCVPMAV